MPDTPANRPAGRQRVGGGAGKSVGTHGPGLGTGPVGKSDGYAQRRGGSSGGRRSSGSDGRGKLILYLIIGFSGAAGSGQANEQVRSSWELFLEIQEGQYI